MFCRAMEIGLLGSSIAYAIKEPNTLVYIGDKVGVWSGVRCS